MASTIGGVFPAVLMCFTLFFLTAEVSLERNSLLKLSEWKSAVLGLGVSKSGSYFVLVLVFIGVFHSSSDMAWSGRKKSVLSGTSLSFEQGFKQKLAGSLLS